MLTVPRRLCCVRHPSIVRLYHRAAAMEKRDYAVRPPCPPGVDELTGTGCRRGVEHAAVQLLHCRCNTQVWPGHEQASDPRDD